MKKREECLIVGVILLCGYLAFTTINHAGNNFNMSMECMFACAYINGLEYDYSGVTYSLNIFEKPKCICEKLKFHETEFGETVDGKFIYKRAYSEVLDTKYVEVVGVE